MTDVFIGNKPAKAYRVYALLTLNKEGSVNIVARGKYIPKAIGVAMMIKEHFASNLKMNVDIGYDMLQTTQGQEQNKQVRVSKISITLTK
jgi:DNA-binding protein Alba